ncbi:hypothetical protein [Polaribacter ponticola]|uniref:Tripartite tricarboxylate transporter TctB family protein n=1 Tax=Polaribacter ponticola TaxID=2978475 RepID=A0ABT5S9L8_9FLAO|nr:hypothetical protein [Polaribacter sp. MSW5]MDD7914778.1 hypothetical protein [Polaribacter sp. MSW5]
MSKQDNNQLNFSLKEYSSIQIGIYFLFAAFLIKSILEGFLIDDNPLGMMSAEIIELLVLIIILFTLLFSSLALFFKGRRKIRKKKSKLWNSKTKNISLKYLASFSIIIFVLIFLNNQGFINYLTPAFLLFYGLSLIILKIKKSKNIFILSIVSFMLAVICFMIPNYWYSSIFILGIAHITYGVVVKN